jgi:hypothetical protein
MRVRNPRPAGGLVLSRRASGFLLAVAVWSWVIWPTFLRNIARDDRSFHGGSPTSFFLVHLVLVVVSLAIGTALGVLGWRGWRASRPVPSDEDGRRAAERQRQGA